MRDNNGMFLKGHFKTKEEKIKVSISVKNSWKLRDNYHGYYGTKIYNTWRSMKNRCNGTSSKECNKKYYDKGISYIENWGEFKNFLEDMLPTYIDGLQLDRINNDIGYNKENCRWVDSKKNNNNRTNNVRIEYLGQIKTLSEWADYLEIKFTTIRNRYYVYFLKNKCDLNHVFRK